MHRGTLTAAVGQGRVFRCARWLPHRPSLTLAGGSSHQFVSRKRRDRRLLTYAFSQKEAKSARPTQGLGGFGSPNGHFGIGGSCVRPRILFRGWITRKKTYHF